MTRLSAVTMGLPDRGVLRPGAYADILVFDPDRIRDAATFQHPHQLAEGVEHVLVNGTLTRYRGAFTGKRPGRVLRR